MGKGHVEGLGLVELVQEALAKRRDLARGLNEVICV